MARFAGFSADGTIDGHGSLDFDGLTTFFADLQPAMAARRRGRAVGDDPDRFATLLDMPIFDRLIDSGALESRWFKLVREGRPLDRRLYCDAEGRLRPPAVRKLCNQGVSVVVNRIDRALPAVAALTGEMAARLGFRTQANAYLTAGRAGALARHSDDHDVVVLQVAGRKLWRLENGEGMLGPGDALYLPRGAPHEVVPVTAPSLHLTIGIETGVHMTADSP